MKKLGLTWEDIQEAIKRSCLLTTMQLVPENSCEPTAYRTKVYYFIEEEWDMLKRELGFTE